MIYNHGSILMIILQPDVLGLAAIHGEDHGTEVVGGWPLARLEVREGFAEHLVDGPVISLTFSRTVLGAATTPTQLCAFILAHDTQLVGGWVCMELARRILRDQVPNSFGIFLCFAVHSSVH